MAENRASNSQYNNLLRLIYRIRLWLIVCPVIAAVYIYTSTGSMINNYDASTLVFAGVVSGYDIESSNKDKGVDWAVANSEIDNLINIMTSEATLYRVALRLYAQHMVHGDPNADNEYIKANNYRTIAAKTPKEVLDLIDKKSEDSTFNRLLEYSSKKPLHSNFVYGLFHWHQKYYSKDYLSKITSRRSGSSDLLQINYTSDDPGIVYNTILFLIDEFNNQYNVIRYSQTDDVIAFFEAELVKVDLELKESEDFLKEYSVKNRIVNYTEQSKAIAYINSSFQIQHEMSKINYATSSRLVSEMEQKIEEATSTIKNNAGFIDRMRKLSDIRTRMTAIEAMKGFSYSNADSLNYLKLQTQYDKVSDELREFTQKVDVQRYSVNGIASDTYIDQWLNELINKHKSEAELKELDRRSKEIDSQYVHFSPIGIVLDQKKRDINFSVQKYTETLSSLNAARLRQKNLKITSATLKVMNPPTFPLASNPSKRKLLVIGGFFGAIVFVIGFFLLLEIFDSTLKNKFRTERSTGGRVLGAIPKREKGTEGRFYPARMEIATRFIANSLVGFFNKRKPIVINILSIDKRQGKSELADSLLQYWRERGVSVSHFNHEEHFDIDSRQYLFAESIDKMCDCSGSDIVIVEFPSLLNASIPHGLLNSADVNLVLLNSESAWKNSDINTYNNISREVDPERLRIILTNVKRDWVEDFTGILPPYTLLRRIIYKIINRGFTAK